MPLKFQSVFARLQMKIISGEWCDGSKIPTEMELCKQYGVSRVTIRRALDGLVSNGYISRTRGKGSFVISRREIIGRPRQNSNIDFSQDEPSYRYQILLREKIPASPRDLEQMGKTMKSHSERPELWHFRSLRLKEETPSVLSDYYFSENIGEILSATDSFLDKSFYEIVGQHLGEKCHFSQGTVAAIIPNDEICKTLQIKTGTASLWCRGVCVLADGTVVGRCTNIFNGSLFEFAVETDSNHC
ncbi:GntR family transcriptional regulator [uncultured Sphaerochaeta sp.]|uniref:GntR family transcriptional regulator n=1 Tax=uncultured Sphaerochaeta sp. TaxID=886478 RepID=UPI002A0A291A|nr:GntR family transcriptional regulator [uncultured Sphaerochaeta sp.]